MKKLFLAVCFMTVVCCGLTKVQAQEINFNDSWKFFNAEADGAEQANFNDSKWRNLSLPHDWAIEGPFDYKHNARTGGLPVTGTGWYRKNFKMPQDAKGKVVRIEFEGAMYDAHVWVNGQFIGNRPNGYIGFEFDISKYLKYDGSDNTIAVRLRPQDLASRWYPGAGLYRSVWMKIDETVHVGHWGSYITTPTVTAEKAVVQNETTVVNKENKKVSVIVKHEYFSPAGKSVSTVDEMIEIAPNSSKVSALYSFILKPERWDTETPNLYKTVTTLTQNGKVVDTYETKIGLRSIAFTKDGFFLNNKKVRFNGVCLHHDNGSLGSAVYKRADQRKLQMMKDMGTNAIRTSHNPPSTEFLEVCDELGLLVLDESFDMWKMPKVENGYSMFFDEWAERDLKDMIRRDRNHPSIVMWSTGNEILEQGDKKNGWKVAKMLNDYCKEVDPSRPTTMGMNNYSNPYDNNFAQQVDIAGVNYKPSKYSEIRANYPELPFYGSETSSCTSSRGIYHLPIEKYEKHASKHVTSYDIIGPSWAYPPDIEFHFQEENPFVMGEFIWTGFDYLGEPTPYGGRDNSTNGHWNGDWPSHSSYFGAVDLAGFPKDRFFLYQSHWSTKPMIHLLPHWNWKGMEGKEIPVYCYTNVDEAELFVNGKSMGRKVKGKDLTEIKVNFIRYEPKTFQSKYRLSWNVPYEPGTIKVVGYKNGKAVNEEVIRTAGKPAKISLSVDRSKITADGQDLAYVTVKIQDKDGNLVPDADNLVNFSVNGVGTLVGVDNGNQISLESFIEPKRKAFSGMCLAILKSSKSSGKITLKATSKSLKSAEVTIETK
ncbi:glycoside hydrolase family 2 TIM barrel-domain containing protein [Flavobacterium sp. 7A]|uniref:glycoside hydrolase family 2 TIM barrel-domain containing protein n=1 Tax=Flavobacterium sp. 7A TaxID=2940571 RepID=UPI002225D469|nr:glycoside hydrolase family 2 TIM barrel-domain containing protein [Flavobacterium sp. 7A]MCW2119049.1 beta-galactosidase [Flavobacterium sp. 7A]